MYASLNVRMDRIEADLTSVKERLSRIEGWMPGAFVKRQPRLRR